MSVDIAVVGGGPSGLFAALGLIRAFEGLTVKVRVIRGPDLVAEASLLGTCKSFKGNDKIF